MNCVKYSTVIESIIPPRCRKERLEIRTKEVTVSVKEMTDETFPVAYTITKDTHNNNEVKSFRFELRSDDGQLFTKYPTGYEFWEKNIRAPKMVADGLKEAIAYVNVRDSLLVDSLRSEAQLDELAEKTGKMLRIFDGTFWFYN